MIALANGFSRLGEFAHGARTGRVALRSAFFEANGGARLRQEFAWQLLCNRQWPLDSELSCESTHALFGRAGMPVRVGKMAPAIPLAAALAILLSAMVARLIHT